MNERGNLSPDERELVRLARAAARQAHAPYSHFNVGAAVRTAAGGVYAGCNVENASFGLTVCAERNAIAAAVLAEGRNVRLVAIACVTEAGAGAPPCGACRQVMAELAGPDAVVLYQTEVDAIVRTRLGSLLPDAFGLSE